MVFVFLVFRGLFGDSDKWQAMLLCPQRLLSQAQPCGPSVKICLLGSLPKPGASGQVGPKCQRRFAPYASQSLTLLFLLSARLRVAQQIVNVGLDGRDLLHIRLATLLLLRNYSFFKKFVNIA